MSESITLITLADSHEVEAVRNGELPEVHRKHVVGITAPDGRTIVDHIYETHRPHEYTAEEEELVLSGDRAERVLEFYRRCQVAPPHEQPIRDCHAFVGYVLGKREIDNSRRFYVPEDNLTLADPHRPMIPGEGYVLTNLGDAPAKKRYVHSMLGLHDPRYNLAVMGVNQPLFIVGNRNTTESYGGDMHRVNI